MGKRKRSIKPFLVLFIVLFSVIGGIVVYSSFFAPPQKMQQSGVYIDRDTVTLKNGTQGELITNISISASLLTPDGKVAEVISQNPFSVLSTPSGDEIQYFSLYTAWRVVPHNFKLTANIIGNTTATLTYSIEIEYHGEDGYQSSIVKKYEKTESFTAVEAITHDYNFTFNLKQDIADWYNNGHGGVEFNPNDPFYITVSIFIKVQGVDEMNVKWDAQADFSPSDKFTVYFNPPSASVTPINDDNSDSSNTPGNPNEGITPASTLDYKIGNIPVLYILVPIAVLGVFLFIIRQRSNVGKRRKRRR